MGEHAAVAVSALGDEDWVRRVLEGDPTVELEPRVATTLEFLRRLTIEPWDLTPAALDPMRQAGVSDAAIEEAIAVCTVFSIIDRLADAFDFPMSTDKQRGVNVTMLTRLGYAAGVIPGGG